MKIGKRNTYGERLGELPPVADKKTELLRELSGINGELATIEGLFSAPTVTSTPGGAVEIHLDELTALTHLRHELLQRKRVIGRILADISK